MLKLRVFDDLEFLWPLGISGSYWDRVWEIILKYNSSGPSKYIPSRHLPAMIGKPLENSARMGGRCDHCQDFPIT